VEKTLPLLSPIRKRKVHEEIAAQLESLISSGALSEGDALPAERDLMKQFSVGRSAVREAMLALERSGLVRLSNGERARVSRPTTASVLDGLSASVRVVLAQEQGMRDFQAARTMFEVTLARHAAQFATDQQIERLRAALKANHDTLGDLSAFERTDVAFHYEIALIVGNPLFTGMHEALVGWLTEQRTVSLRNIAADEQAYEFHRAVYEAIAARDPDLAEKTMRAHLDAVTAMFWNTKRREEGAGG
jgi:GntR family transcriptional repressor for pyruvate dehydrogenase complex